MDALFITTDAEVMRDDSAAYKRMQAYAAMGQHIMVFVLHSRRDAPKPRRVGKTLWIVPIFGFIRPLAAYRARRVARRELYFQKKFQVEVIDAADTMLSAFAGMLIARKFGCALHVRAIGYASRRPHSAMGALPAIVSRFLLAKADAVSTDSEDVHAKLIRQSPEWLDRVFLVPRSLDIAVDKDNAIPAGSVDIRTKYPQFKIILLAVAPLTPEYNMQLAIYTIAGVVHSYKFAGLVIVGEGPERQALEALVRKLGVADHVVFEYANADLAAYYKSAHIFLVTAPKQEYGNTIAEAAAGSCTIVSTNVGLAAAFLKNGESAYICDVNDPLCFVKTIAMLITHPPVRDRVRLNGMLALEGFMAQNDPATQLDITKKAWDAALKHASLVRREASAVPKAARAKDERMSA